MIAPVVFALYCWQEALLRVQREHGQAFLARMIECAEKPWLIKR